MKGADDGRPTAKTATTATSALRGRAGKRLAPMRVRLRGLAKGCGCRGRLKASGACRP